MLIPSRSRTRRVVLGVGAFIRGGGAGVGRATRIRR